MVIKDSGAIEEEAQHLSEAECEDFFLGSRDFDFADGFLAHVVACSSCAQRAAAVQAKLVLVHGRRAHKRKLPER